MALNDIDAAVESFKKALELEPNDGECLPVCLSMLLLLLFMGFQMLSNFTFWLNLFWCFKEE